MINVTDATKELYMHSSHKVVRIVFPNKSINLNNTLDNTNLVSESVELTEILESGKYIEFRGCNSSTFKFKVAGLLQDVRGEYIEVSIQAGNTDIIPLFKGYVVSQNNRTFEDITSEIECQDIMYQLRNVDVTSWYNSLTYPITIKNFRDSLFNYLNIDQVVDVHSEDDTGSLINDSLTINKIDSAKLPKVLNAGDLMQDICQVNARPGQIGRDGKFHYRHLREIIKGTYPSYETFPTAAEGYTDPETGIYYPPIYPSGENADAMYNVAHYKKINYEPYMVETIKGVNIRDNEGNKTHYGDNDNVFEIKDNMIASSLVNKAQACQNIYSEVAKMWYIPLTLDAIGYPWIECGDIILTRTKKNIVRSFMLKRTLKGIQGLYDTITSSGEQYRELYTESEATGVSTNRSGVKDAQDGVVRCNTLIADEVNARSGQFNNLNTRLLAAEQITAIAITTQNLSAQTISANQISGGTISAGVIGAGSIKAEKLDANSFSSWTMNCQGLSCTNFWFGGVRCGTKRFDQLSAGDIVVTR